MLVRACSSPYISFLFLIHHFSNFANVANFLFRIYEIEESPKQNLLFTSFVVTIFHPFINFYISLRVVLKGQ